MLKWDSVFEWGRRASDCPVPAPAMDSQDPLLESVIAHEQVEVRYQPLMVPGTGEIVGVEALARTALTRTAEALFARATAARLDERLSRVVQRKALRCRVGRPAQGPVPIHQRPAG
jgi:EAL domain-containing protein (putative c-di-GMP-specific phosphodiesterase class I)